MNTQWSYSSLKTFEQCPKKYYHLKVARDFKDEGSEATVYGSEAHKAAELFISNGEPLPKRFAYMQPVLNALNAMNGEKHCELELGVTEDYEPTGFHSDDVWLRTIVDLLVINGPNAYLIDYKTSKSAKYADTTQLDIMAAAVLTHFPQVQHIKSGLLFVVSNEFIRKEHKRDLHMSYYATFDPALARLRASMDNGVWNPISGPLCRFCPVSSCPHNRSR